MGGRCSAFCAAVPCVNNTGPNMLMPKPNSGCRAPSCCISSFRIWASAGDSPPPPYSRGQVGTVQPRSTMSASQRWLSGFLNTALRPPQTRSSSGMGVRNDAGQWVSSQCRVSRRKVSRGSTGSLQNKKWRARAAIRAAVGEEPTCSAHPVQFSVCHGERQWFTARWF